MTIALTVLQIVAPVFLLAAIGYIWVKSGNEYRVEFVTRLAMTLSVPCLIFTALMKTEIDPNVLAITVWASVAAYGGITLIFWALVVGFRLEQRTYLAPLIFGNTGNLGLPLALFAFGEEGLSYAVVIFAVMAIYSFTFGIWLVSGGESGVKALKEPLVPATLLGGLFLFMGWQTPIWLTNTLELVGQMAIPMMLITLGVALARLEIRRFGRAIWLVLVRVVVCVFVAALVGVYFALPPIPFAVLVVQISTPVAVTSYLLAEKYGADSGEAAGLVIISTLFSVITIPLTLAFLVG